MEKTIQQAPRSIPLIVDRPVIRYLGRSIDFALLAPCSLLLTLLAAQGSNALFVLALFSLALSFPCLFEAGCLSLWGSTPGKWLCGTYVYARNGDCLSFRCALRRTFLVYTWGLAWGLPFLSSWSQLRAFQRLWERGDTYWDRTVDSRVQHHQARWPLLMLVLVIPLLAACFIG
jgi:uncharacterized RDD family membrane protein YckC